MARRFVGNRVIENDGAVVQKQVAVAGTTVTVTAETQQEIDEQIANLVGPEVAARVRAVYAETALSALGSWRSLVLALRDRLPF